jgi:hypothetical protein
MSPNLSQSFGRAQEFAREQSHRALLLEHVLLALTEDPEASGVLRACNVDIVRLGTDISGYLGRLMDDMRAPPGSEPSVDAELLRVIEAARQAAQQSRRRAIDGAIVLAAIVGDGKSPAAGLLKAQGMTFDEAIKTLQKASAQARSKQYATDRTQPTERPAAKEPEQPAAPPPQERTQPASVNPPQPSGQSVDDILAAARARIQQRSGSASAKPEPLTEPRPEPRLEPRLEARPDPKPSKAAPEPELPLMNLSSFTAAPAPPPPPDMPDLPLRAGRPTAAPGLPPTPTGSSPAPPLPGGPQQAGPEPILAPPRAFQRPGEGAPRPPPRRGDRAARGERPDVAESPLPGPRPPVGVPNGAMGGPRRSAEASRSAGRAAPARSGQRAAAGPLMEAIPRRMRVGSATPAQVRIGRDKVEALMQLLASGRPQASPDGVVASVLSVRLLAPEGAFAIDPETPETQWVETAPALPQDDHVGWRWSVTPLQRGWHRLQLVVTARTVGRDGRIGPETAPPDRVIEVAVRPRLLRRLIRSIALLVLFGIGIALGRLSQDRLAQDVLDFGGLLIKNVLGLLRTSGFLGGS